MKLLVKNAHVVSPGVEIENASILVKDGKIAKVSKRELSEKGCDKVYDARGKYVMPGFIDVHTHGALTHDFCDADPQAVFKLAEGKEIEAEFHLLDTIERLTPVIMKEEKGTEKTFCANVDMYSGLVYRMLGIPDELFTPLFAVARIAGWSAHRMEEILTSSRIIRPAYKAIAKEKEYIKLTERE